MYPIDHTGFQFSSDPRDANFKFSNVVKDRPQISEKNWWSDGWWGDQGISPHCCAYAWLHVIEDGPVIQDRLPNYRSPIIKPEKFYNQCKLIDGLPGKGTTIRAGAKVAQDLGLVSEYRWAKSIQDVVDALTLFGPVIAGTHWYKDMDRPTRGVMRASGELISGHAYVLNGVNLITKQFRIKNSSGKNWGDRGYGYISFSDFDKLLRDGGEVVVPFERKLDHFPNL